MLSHLMHTVFLNLLLQWANGPHCLHRLVPLALLRSRRSPLDCTGSSYPVKVATFFRTFFTAGFTTFNKRSARGFASSAEVVATTAIEVRSSYSTCIRDVSNNLIRNSQIFSYHQTFFSYNFISNYLFITL